MWLELKAVHTYVSGAQVGHEGLFSKNSSSHIDPNFGEASLADYPQFEIPMPMRELAGRNVEQARAAYGQYMDMARAAQDLIGTMVPSNPVTAGIKDAQNQSMRFAQQTVDAMFALASELTNAKDLHQVFEIQGRHAQTQMQAYSSQAQELGRRMVDMAQKA